MNALRGLLRRRRLLFVLGGIVVVLAGLALAGYLYEHHRTGSVYHPHARFIPQPTPTAPPKGPEDRFSWPLYGYSKDHTRFFPASSSLHPPFKQVWLHNGSALLEFPPVIYGERIFQLADNGVLTALNRHTGEVLWQHHVGRLSASTPAVTASTVYATVLASGHPRVPGRLVALNAATGQVRWFRSLPSPSESSPLIDRGRIFFGSQSGNVYALDDATGHLIWTYHADGSVKASPTLSGGKLYFGDYSGHVQAVSERSGHLIWRSSSEGALLGSGTFYSTAAVFYGRVFLGNTDGRIYAYDASTGHLDWAVQTGAYVYASPAVTNAPGIGPTVYLGSYNGTFYALNARTGHVRWSFHANGRISGSATIVGNIVYFADLGLHRTYGLGISTGMRVFEKQSGSFDPVISDGKNIYLTGYSGLFDLAPFSSGKSAPRSQRLGPARSAPRRARSQRKKP
jgi:outer membrane protein assembly factor BamB